MCSDLKKDGPGRRAACCGDQRLKVPHAEREHNVPLLRGHGSRTAVHVLRPDLVLRRRSPGAYRAQRPARPNRTQLTQGDGVCGESVAKRILFEPIHWSDLPCLVAGKETEGDVRMNIALALVSNATLSCTWTLTRVWSTTPPGQPCRTCRWTLRPGIWTRHSGW